MSVKKLVDVSNLLRRSEDEDEDEGEGDGDGDEERLESSSFEVSQSSSLCEDRSLPSSSSSSPLSLVEEFDLVKELMERGERARLRVTEVALPTRLRLALLANSLRSVGSSLSNELDDSSGPLSSEA